MVLVGAAIAAPFVGCSGADGERENTEGVTGVENQLGLRVTYDTNARRLDARTNRPLEEGEQVYVRARRGSLSVQSERDLSCGELAESGALAGPGVAIPTGMRFEGPAVDASLLELHKRFGSEAWQRGEISAEDIALGTDAVVEACVVKNGQVQAKVQTSLAYATDLARSEARVGRSVVLAAAEERIESVEKYAEFCVQELGEIPFFKKIANGKYETFDCRDFVGSNGTGAPAKIAGVEGALIPLTVDDVRKDTCDTTKPGGGGFNNYNCVNKCDKSQYLSEGCEPGPTVTTAKNDKGTHWVLLCRAGEDPSHVGMTKAKKFNDMAMIGHNPKTGKTCFFQNQIASKTDGAHIAHPGDLAKAKNTWEPSPEGYCMTSCHSADAFVHSPWIDGALRKDGRSIVPKMGEHPDFPISWNDAPYYVLNMDAQGWEIGRQLVSEEASACTTCHRIAGPQGGRGMMTQFTPWGTAVGLNDTNNSFFAKMTDSYKASFEKTHTMPTRVDGLNFESWKTSKWKKAADHIIACGNNPNAAGCVFADVPRGPLNPPRPTL
ncbi:hypothetical protein LZC95_26480 [Pendulispora brunnea]|uniref:Cytochrome c domain-containing protein n=1 Tax=Pendulispora brunnea TaxID=2905690 RepID=A0ABZ2JYL6_9BACT